MNDDKSLIIRFLNKNDYPLIKDGIVTLDPCNEKVFFTITYMNHQSLLCASKNGIDSYTDALNLAQ